MIISFERRAVSTNRACQVADDSPSAIFPQALHWDHRYKARVAPRNWPIFLSPGPVAHMAQFAAMMTTATPNESQVGGQKHERRKSCTAGLPDRCGRLFQECAGLALSCTDSRVQVPVNGIADRNQCE
jgi:hypothetical protein